MRALAACAVAAVSFHSLEAAACGCFATSTTVADPVIQAGERILFVQQGNQVTSIVQIKFQGDATDFGWLLPVPAVPDVKVGTDEMFEVLDLATRPSFQLTTSVNPSCRPQPSGGGGIGFGCGSPAFLSSRSTGEGFADAGSNAPSPLVLRDTAGPYDYAVLKADSQADVQNWLNSNRFFVPVTSDAALRPYIRPGGYFLALKLRSGQTTGDLRPVVLNFTSDYPMIPLILTSATAVPNMGVQVFMLGTGRAIPRNYHHVELNLLKLDWGTAENYGALVTAAVAEAPAKHAFVTEYAGTSSVVHGQLNPTGARFGSKSQLAATTTPEAFVTYLYDRGFTMRGTQELSETLMGVLAMQIPYAAATGVTRQEFYRQLRYYLAASTRTEHPEWYMGWPGVTFDATVLAEAVWSAVAQPILDADALLNTHPYLTRLFTSLSPVDMTADPVFAINTSLPPVETLRLATRQTGCSGVPDTFSVSGYDLPDESRLTQEKKDAMPAAARIEQLSEEGPPVEVFAYVLDSSLTSKGARFGWADALFVIGLVSVWLLLRRRKFE